MGGSQHFSLLIGINLPESNNTDRVYSRETVGKKTWKLTDGNSITTESGSCAQERVASEGIPGNKHLERIYKKLLEDVDNSTGPNSKPFSFSSHRGERLSILNNYLHWQMNLRIRGSATIRKFAVERRGFAQRRR
jgi:hypothetical protein